MKALLMLAALVLVLPPASSRSAGTVYFDDSDPEIMVLGNGACYEIGLRKSNGSIAYITDKTTGEYVTLGSRREQLWGAWFPDGTPNYVGGASYGPSWPNHFGYAWSAATNTLTLSYTPDPAAAQKVTAQVTVVASEECRFDLHLQLQNGWGYRMDYALFPSEWVFAEADVQEALLPILPGVVLDSGFFEQHRTYVATYPGYPGIFADYVALSLTGGHLVIYSLHESGPLQPAAFGLVHDDLYIADSTYCYHAFPVGLDDGGSWSSPTVRVWVSLPTMDTILAYRADNGLDQFRSLPDKLGARYLALAASPLYKADTVQLGIPFTAYASVLPQIPTPGILHPVAYQPGGHDENYPDFLPPDPQWGTTEEMAAMFRQAQAFGLMVMPYTNPTWWDDESPTIQIELPPIPITDIAVLDDQGVPRYEYYDSHGGYVVSPYAPFVQQRLDRLIEEMRVDLPSDLLFEDQIGARPWLFDYNRFSPSPTSYSEGWLDHTRVYSDVLLMTELGFDRLAETEAGFHGSVLLPQYRSETSGWWGAGNWHAYPLAPMLMRDKVSFYQHDLAPETMTDDKQTLTWNLAFGYMLSYDLGFDGGLDGPWLGLVSAFQKHVLARYAVERVTDFQRSGQVTQTAFETAAVTANWSDTNPHDVGRHTLPPLGVVVTNTNESVTAGVFTRYNDQALSAGDHYLIEERLANEIVVRQPLGADTEVTVKLLPAWNSGHVLRAWAYTAQGQIIGQVPLAVIASDARFSYQQELAGQAVAYYRVLRTSRTYLPLVLKGW